MAENQSEERAVEPLSEEEIAEFAVAVGPPGTYPGVGYLCDMRRMLATIRALQADLAGIIIERDEANIMANQAVESREKDFRRANRAEVEREEARSNEWKAPLLGLLKTFPEYQDQPWEGDKEGWGFAFELIKFVHKEGADSQAQLAALREAALRFRAVAPPALVDGPCGTTYDCSCEGHQFFRLLSAPNPAEGKKHGAHCDVKTCPEVDGRVQHSIFNPAEGKVLVDAGYLLHLKSSTNSADRLMGEKAEWALEMISKDKENTRLRTRVEELENTLRHIATGWGSHRYPKDARDALAPRAEKI